jgi:hypothetical protein
MAFAALGAGELLLARPDEVSARHLLHDAVSVLESTGTNPSWPWPEDRLTYSNGSIVEALLLAGEALPDTSAQTHGLYLLRFLLRMETGQDRLSVTPVGGRGPFDSKPGFDQQPIEVAAIGAACARAYELTDDPEWLQGVQMSWAWFLGDNDISTPMFDPSTGGGFDGLQRHGKNLNQGAESTLAVLATAQHAQRLVPLGRPW